jgi:hypothetical protein
MPLLWRLALLTCLGSLLCSCGPRRLPGIPAYSSFVPIPSNEAEQFLSKHNERVAELITLKFTADVSISKGLIKKSFLQSLVFRAPDSLRIESFVPGINQLISLIIINSDVLYVRDYSEGRTYSTEPTTENIAKLIYLPLLPFDLAVFLVGVGMEATAEGEFGVNVARSGNIIRIESTRDGENRIEQYFRTCEEGDSKTQLIALRVYRIRDSSDLLRGSFTPLSGPCGISDRILLDIPDQGIRGEVRPRKLLLNEKLKPSIFEVP